VWSATSGISREDPGFLQRRVALFGLAGASLGLIFLLFRVVMAVATGQYGEFTEASFALHALGAASLIVVWALCRSGPRSRRFVQGTETAGLLASSLAYELMGWSLPLMARPELIVLLALTYGLMARAAYVPSSSWRTFVLSLAIGMPLIAGTYLAYRNAGEEVVRAAAMGLPAVTAEDVARMLAITTAVWWSMTTVLVTATSSVIYGLRRDVREARKLGQYTLGEKLGEGGMGVVYRARHALLRRPTAIKLLPPEKAGEQSVARFEREVQLTAGLSHPNTVTIFDFGRTPEGIFYYAMELLDGAAIDVIVGVDGPQPPERVLHVLDGVTGALMEAHEIGLVHRDVKPANIILCKQGGLFDVPKVVDFGLVKDLAAGGVALTATATLAGTPLYMSPEAITLPSSMDGRGDLYALGAVGYFMLTGTHVFPGRTPIEVCGHHLHTRPEPPSARLGRAVPADLERLILDCLEKDPGRRPQTAAALQQRVRECRAYGAWDRERARLWWQENGAKLGRDLSTLRTLSHVTPEPATMERT
jgi:eukaryotic-like serine/threonine-protein kinase